VPERRRRAVSSLLSSYHNLNHVPDASPRVHQGFPQAVGLSQRRQTRNVSFSLSTSVHQLNVTQMRPAKQDTLKLSFIPHHRMHSQARSLRRSFMKSSRLLNGRSKRPHTTFARPSSNEVSRQVPAGTGTQAIAIFSAGSLTEIRRSQLKVRQKFDKSSIQVRFKFSGSSCKVDDVYHRRHEFG
jgi:hypothetical protein